MELKEQEKCSTSCTLHNVSLSYVQAGISNQTQTSCK